MPDGVSGSGFRVSGSGFWVPGVGEGGRPPGCGLRGAGPARPRHSRHGCYLQNLIPDTRTPKPGTRHPPPTPGQRKPFALSGAAVVYSSPAGGWITPARTCRMEPALTALLPEQGCKGSRFNLEVAGRSARRARRGQPGGGSMVRAGRAGRRRLAATGARCPPAPRTRAGPAQQRGRTANFSRNQNDE